jgi:hypothetical protein
MRSKVFQRILDSVSQEQKDFVDWYADSQMDEQSKDNLHKLFSKAKVDTKWMDKAREELNKESEDKL